MYRIAEFETDEDALLFLRLKGKEDFTLVGGINLPFAVAQKRSRAICVGRDEPTDYVDDHSREFDETLEAPQ
jgi:hypothetical protein